MPSGVYASRLAKTLQDELQELGAKQKVADLLAHVKAIVARYPQAMNGHAPEPVSAPAPTTPDRPLRKPMTAGQKRKLSEQMRARWATHKEAGGGRLRKTTEDAPLGINPRNGKPYKMSAEGRAKIAKAAKKRFSTPEGLRTLAKARKASAIVKKAKRAAQEDHRHAADLN